MLGINQAVPIARARRVALETVRTIDGVLPDPPPVVFFDAVGDLSNDRHVLSWTAPPTRFSELTTKSEATERLYDAFQTAGIGFPYPTQTVHLARPDSRERDGRSCHGRGEPPADAGGSWHRLRPV